MKKQKTKNRYPSLPAPERRGLNREEAAAFIGVGPSKFDTLVSDNRMPKPKKIDGRRVWDVRALDQYFDLLPGSDDSDHNVWDE
jgi:predicted DNA-binding transcriptional regulator AlpA